MSEPLHPNAKAIAADAAHWMKVGPRLLEMVGHLLWLLDQYHIDGGHIAVDARALIVEAMPCPNISQVSVAQEEARVGKGATVSEILDSLDNQP
jgi:hypothetical protein